MTISAAMQAEMFAEETGDGLLQLLTVSHAELSTTLRVVHNTESVISRGELFTDYPFELVLPESHPDRFPSARLTIDNVSLEITQALRSIVTPAEVLVEVVQLKDPDVVELSLPNLYLRNVRIDVRRITGELVARDLQAEPFPYITFSPGTFPGAF